MFVHEKAQFYAKAAHMAIGQVRKYTGEPYHTHPDAVAEFVRYIGGSLNMIAAAHLHDVIEDTEITEEDLLQDFSKEVVDLVVWLSDLQTLDVGNRKIRKYNERCKLAKAPAEAQTIKLADLIHNSYSITAHDPEFSIIYLKEMRATLSVMAKGDSRLHDLAMEIVNRPE